jgi:hypothetical protein
MIKKEEADEKVNEGWLRAWMMFEVLAVNEKTTREALESLINRLDSDKRAEIYNKKFSNLKKVDKPLPNIDSGFSLTCEVELISKKFENLVDIVIEYGPSAIEILEPSNFELKAGEAQTILNSIAKLLHDFAAAGAGGIVLIKGK